jgi:hypothetical protein
MTYLQENIQEYLIQQTADWVQDDFADMQQEFFAKRDCIIQSLVEVIRQLYQQAHSLQEQGRKGAASYIWISLLRTSVLQDTWQYRIDLYDHTFVLDREECTVHWEMNFVWDYLKNRMNQLNEVIRSGRYVNKIRTYHIDKIKLEMAKQYHQQAIYFTQRVIQTVFQNLEDIELDKGTKMKVLMGEYLDHSVVIYEKIQDKSEKSGAVCNTFD